MTGEKRNDWKQMVTTFKKKRFNQKPGCDNNGFFSSVRLSVVLIVVQEGIANPGGTQLGMLGGAPAPPRPPPALPPSATRTALSNIANGVILRRKWRYLTPKMFAPTTVGTAKQTSKIFVPTTVRTAKEMKRHFSANLADRPRICSQNDPIRKNLGTFVRSPQRVVTYF